MTQTRKTKITTFKIIPMAMMFLPFTPPLSRGRDFLFR
jgi:hypothetical protein